MMGPFERLRCKDLTSFRSSVKIRDCNHIMTTLLCAKLARCNIVLEDVPWDDDKLPDFLNAHHEGKHNIGLEGSSDLGCTNVELKAVRLLLRLSRRCLYLKSPSMTIGVIHHPSIISLVNLRYRNVVTSIRKLRHEGELTSRSDMMFSGHVVLPNS